MAILFTVWCVSYETLKYFLIQVLTFFKATVNIKHLSYLVVNVVFTNPDPKTGSSSLHFLHLIAVKHIVFRGTVSVYFQYFYFVCQCSFQ